MLLEVTWSGHSKEKFYNSISLNCSRASVQNRYSSVILITIKYILTTQAGMDPSTHYTLSMCS